MPTSAADAPAPDMDKAFVLQARSKDGQGSRELSLQRLREAPDGRERPRGSGRVVQQGRGRGHPGQGHQTALTPPGSRRAERGSPAPRRAILWKSLPSRGPSPRAIGAKTSGGSGATPDGAASQHLLELGQRNGAALEDTRVRIGS
eukprot:12781853-Alexandrium_andersonii.AAC.1